jgi:hypothetical protein
MAASDTAARTQSFTEPSLLFEYISFPDLCLIGLWLRNWRRYELVFTGESTQYTSVTDAAALVL